MQSLQLAFRHTIVQQLEWTELTGLITSPQKADIVDELCFFKPSWTLTGCF